MFFVCYTGVLSVLSHFFCFFGAPKKQKKDVYHGMRCGVCTFRAQASAALAPVWPDMRLEGVRLHGGIAVYIVKISYYYYDYKHNI